MNWEGVSMKFWPRIAVAACVSAALAVPALAADLKLQIRNGRVTLEARDVSVREILAEWGRIGQTSIVNGEKVGGGPVTLTLTDIPERDALDILLRSVSGYMAAPRAADTAGGSIYDRIFVLAAARPAPSGAAAPAATSGQPQQMFRGRPQSGPGSPPTFRPTIQPPDDTADDEPLTPGPMRPGMFLDQMPYQSGGGQPGPGAMTPLMPGAMQMTPSGAVNQNLPSYPGAQSTSTPGAATPGLPPGTTSVPGMVAPGTPPKPIKPPGSSPGGLS
jgi:hypothetical protein